MSGLEIIKLIHYGKCNDVFVTRDSEGNKYAMKRFYKQELEKRKDYTNEKGRLVKRDWFRDFKRSLDIQLVIDHDSCIKCHSVFGIDLSNEEPKVEDEIELVLEFAECGSLMELESFDVPVPDFPKEVVKCVARDILCALDYLSKINVAHRDVKPNNIFMNKHGRSKLGDFGESDFMTKDGKVGGSRGSYYFLAPEVFEPGNEKDGGAIDMWALGITLWILYFRAFPLKGLDQSPFQAILEIQNFNPSQELDFIKGENSEVESDFLDLLKAMLERDPNRRIRPKEALIPTEVFTFCQEHAWFRRVDYEAARAFSEDQIKKFNKIV